ncbi:phosphatase PAP2 family protein [Gluconobacter sp. Dm-62]|uniref:acid phosphatase n=1 Tax=Gluconobacter sp. Dm-62 TaxID=2799804 RepID=UPI001B8B82F7|nr:phosphatase PAP2 family protein [Gluconobacter sp. Dm-62]MBS1104154.1 phosphatase PAP2 family protein [Gluconobacter sp. Dm-62]
MRSATRLPVALLLCATVLSACAPSASQNGILPDSVAPDERLVLAPPPVAGSAAQIDDDRVFRVTRALKDTPRWKLAQSDADLEPAHVVRDFSCAMGFDIDLSKAPHLARVLERIRHAVGHRTSEVKNYWHRTRPFVGTNLPICTSPEGLGLHSSYPSGHTTAGYGMALLLAHLMPDHAAAILQRGRVFGESRIVCGAHWKSDVQAGYLNASSLMDVLLAQPELQDDLAAARRELLAMQGSATAPDAGQCAVEHDAATHSLLTEP